MSAIFGVPQTRQMYGNFEGIPRKHTALFGVVIEWPRPLFLQSESKMSSRNWSIMIVIKVML